MVDIDMIEEKGPEGPNLGLEDKAFGESPITIYSAVDKCMELADSPKEYSFCISHQMRELTVKSVDRLEIVDMDEGVAVKAHKDKGFPLYINFEEEQLTEDDIPTGWREWVRKTKEK